MSIRHHVSEDLIMAYAAGSLAQGWSLAVATHLAMCPECRAHYERAQEIGGTLLDNQELEDDPSLYDSGMEEVWARLRGKLDQPYIPTQKIQPKVSAKTSIGLPEPLRSFVGADIDELKWKSLGKGAYQIRIPVQDDETSVRLLRIPAGKPVPEHSHGGRELTLVLRGAFRDEVDMFRRGDIEDADGSITHTPTATEDEDCICLAVTDAPLKFTSWIVRAIQPILKI